MSEHMMPIPSRLYNAAVGGHVAGADQIIDDETGLTLDKVAGGALEEKTYTSGSDNGMGRVVLRKNLVEGVNTLTQSMINKSNTIYVIQYDFTLGEDITVPNNCILEFNGGSIGGNYTIDGNNTTYNNVSGFKNNVIYKNFIKTHDSVICVDELTNFNTLSQISLSPYDNSFFNLAENINSAIQYCFNKYSKCTVTFTKGKTYCFSSPIFLYDNCEIDGNQCEIKFNENQSAWLMNDEMAFITNRTHARIEGQDNNHFTTTVFGYKNLTVKNINFTNLQNTKVFGFLVNAERGLIAFCGANNIKIDNIKAENNVNQTFVWLASCSDIEITNCRFTEASGSLYHCFAEFTGRYTRNVYIHNNYSDTIGDEAIAFNISSDWSYDDGSPTGIDIINISNNTIKCSAFLSIYNGTVSDTFDNIPNVIISDNNIIESNYTGEMTIAHWFVDLGGKFNSIAYEHNNIVRNYNLSYLFVSALNDVYINSIEVLYNKVTGSLGVASGGYLKILRITVDGNNGILPIISPSSNPGGAMESIYIKNNFFADLQADVTFKPYYQKAIYIERNYFKGNNSYKLIITGTGFAVINDNLFEEIKFDIDVSVAAITNNISFKTFLSVGDLTTSNNYFIRNNINVNQYMNVNYCNGVVAGSSSITGATGVSVFGNGEFGEWENTLVVKVKDKMERVNLITGGTSSNRPTVTVVGFEYFDTTLGKPIYWNGSAWVDSTGTTV